MVKRVVGTQYAVAVHPHTNMAAWALRGRVAAEERKAAPDTGNDVTHSGCSFRDVVFVLLRGVKKQSMSKVCGICRL